jgi:hypothetical protein
MPTFFFKRRYQERSAAAEQFKNDPKDLYIFSAVILFISACIMSLYTIPWWRQKIRERRERRSPMKKSVETRVPEKSGQMTGLTRRGTARVPTDQDKD